MAASEPVGQGSVERTASREQLLEMRWQDLKALCAEQKLRHKNTVHGVPDVAVRDGLRLGLPQQQRPCSWRFLRQQSAIGSLALPRGDGRLGQLLQGPL